ncbi:uncharacterized protein PGTG_17889 [Puccinia graminis f. sp. tritici CRL 75-36-700-3]|uniref:Uncharacterized protein n=1 Tax=Puccinia graminis f. sp. tritici (strain CRL 75-36-700-3 / race SCCL) TaxID=418459 RepID=E3L6I4_PUCGT|nr:uncharacterized protein PGTG_17889 [Puccinia graminis f. sp. tritici CRL 75-36-700-3]EFP92159.2 hypothetical protein PGTG_17889 [Puccinia graminis f. sp. tritici CRL 75-36-700-3]
MAPEHPDICANADIWLLFPGKQPSASAGGYPPALAGIRAGIFGYPPLKARAVGGGGQRLTGRNGDHPFGLSRQTDPAHLQKVNRNIKIVLILVGLIMFAEELKYSALLAPYLADPENLFVVSSVLSLGGHDFHTYYQDPHLIELAKQLSPGSPLPEYPIHQSIENLYKEAITAISLQDPKQAHKTFKSYLKRKKNTIGSRHPISVLLGSMIKLQQTCLTPPPHEQQLQLVCYEQSSPCFTVRDSSVSYVSAFLRHKVKPALAQRQRLPSCPGCGGKVWGPVEQGDRDLKSAQD